MSSERIHLSVPHMSGAELPLIQEAFNSNWLSTAGPNIALLEQRFRELTGLPALAVSSGTAAIHLGLKVLGLSAGDEVLVPTLAFVAAANAVRYEQAVPTFIDSERRTWNIDPNLLADTLRRRARTNRLPRAVLVVHLYGQAADLPAILETCARYELPVLEDAANALGSLHAGKQLGTSSEVGVFSLSGNKIITATAGGILVSKNPDAIEKARRWSNQARDPDPDGIGNYIHSQVGYNYQMSNVLAAIALGQLSALPERVLQRRTVFERYLSAFQQVPGIEPGPECSFGPGAGLHNRWLSCFLINPREFGRSAKDLLQRLNNANIECRPVWRPMHKQSAYDRFECVGGSVAEDLHTRGICLPSSSSLAMEAQERVIRVVNEAHQSSVTGGK